MYPVETFVINLKERTDRLSSIYEQFRGRDEFSLHIVEAEKHPIGALGLLNTVIKTVRKAKDLQLPYLLICEDDHIFTEEYSKVFFAGAISQAIEREAGILLGGVSSLGTAIEIRYTDLFWVSLFSGSQFVMVFESAYDAILSAAVSEEDHIDAVLCRTLTGKFLIYPFISVQKEFGYSDVTRYYEVNPGYVDKLFDYCANELASLCTLGDFYGDIQEQLHLEEAYMNEIAQSTSIATYLIAGPPVDESVVAQFDDKPEFDLRITTVQGSFWRTVLQVISDAKESEEDVIILCSEQHSFSEDYHTSRFFRAILEAQEQDIDILLGGVDVFHNAIHVTENRYWVTGVMGARFLVIYNSCFEKLLALTEQDYDETVVNLDQLCAITTNKMVLYPFVGKQAVTLTAAHMRTDSRNVIADHRSAGEKLGIYHRYITQTIPEKPMHF